MLAKISEAIKDMWFCIRLKFNALDTLDFEIKKISVIINKYKHNQSHIQCKENHTKRQSKNAMLLTLI